MLQRASFVTDSGPCLRDALNEQTRLEKISMSYLCYLYLVRSHTLPPSKRTNNKDNRRRIRNHSLPYGHVSVSYTHLTLPTIYSV